LESSVVDDALDRVQNRNCLKRNVEFRRIASTRCGSQAVLGSTLRNDFSGTTLSFRLSGFGDVAYPGNANLQRLHSQVKATRVLAQWPLPINEVFSPKCLPTAPTACEV
jgi:hypothetical protein